jgi:hypothetical protein
MSDEVIDRQSLVQRVMGWFDQHLEAKQLCWLCLVFTGSALYFASMHYASASDLGRVDAKVIDVQLQGVQKELIDLRIRQCKDASGDKRWYAERVAELQRRYMALDDSRRPFDLPECNDL